jgi:hypothetical protein
MTNDEPLIDGGFAGPVLLFEFALLEPLQGRNLGRLSSPRLSAPEQTVTGTQSSFSIFNNTVQTDLSNFNVRLGTKFFSILR